MSNAVTVADLLNRNQQYARGHEPFPLLSELAGTDVVVGKILIVTCADPRCVPEQFLGLKAPETVVMRAAGGRVAGILNGLLALDMLLGGFRELMIIHHTDCGASHFTDDGVREHYKKEGASTEALEGMVFGGFTDVAASVRDDIALLKNESMVRRELVNNTTGYVFDIKTGALTKV